MANTTQEYFDEFDGMVFVQQDGPNTEPVPLTCTTIDGVSMPLGDITRRFCRQGDGSIKTANVSQGTVSSITFDVTMWRPKRRDRFQRARERRCSIPVYVGHSLCAGRQDNILAWDAMDVYEEPFVNNKDIANSARGQFEEGDSPEMTGLTYSLSADPNSPEIYKLLTTMVTVANTTAAEGEPLRDITSCTIPRCHGGACGAPQEPCDEMHIIADSQAGTFFGYGYESINNSATYTVWGAPPFAAAEDQASIVCVQIDEDTERLITACGTADAAGLRIAYSDDGGTTWAAAVQISASATDYAQHGGALFALDYRHIWLCTFEADVWFSADGGLTWTDQNAPVPGSDETLMYIHFIDSQYGWAVGGYRTTPTGYLIQTTDGGEHWALAADEPQVEMGNAVAVLDAQNVWVGMDDGTLWYTQNWATTWAQRTLPSVMTNIADVQFLDHYIGYLCGYKAGAGNGVATIMRTFDGGYTWEEYNLATEFDSAVEYMGVNAMHLCHANECHAVTEDIGTSSLVWILKPAGWT